jgi:hypothetical protein
LRQAAAISQLPFWPEVARLYTSREQKTVRVGESVQSVYLHLSPQALPALNEARRPPVYVTDEEYKTQVSRFFTNPAEPTAPGWETAQEAQARIVETIEALRQGEGHLAVISHGLVLTLLRARLLGRKATIDDWLKLSMGCYALANLHNMTLEFDWTTLEN